MTYTHKDRKAGKKTVRRPWKSNKTATSGYGLNSALKIIEPEVMACNLPLRFDPYLACEHNCTYCYARVQKTRYGYWNPDSPKPVDVSLFERQIQKILASSEPLRTPIARALWHRVPIRIGTDTDAFQPCEKKLGVTKRVMEILNKNKYPYIITTKSDLVTKDEYVSLLKESPAGAIVQFTVISLNEDLTGNLEPNATPVSKRLEAMEKLRDEGIYLQNRISPIIPQLTDSKEDMGALCSSLQRAGVKDLIVEYLRYNSFSKRWMTAALDVEPSYFDTIYLKAYKECSTTFPECCSRNKTRFGCRWDERPKMISGYWRMPLRLKLEKYKEFKRQAETLDLRLYVCSEEFPEINGCVNCCGIRGEEARKYLRFDRDNEACANNIACFIERKGNVTKHDVLDGMFSIDERAFKKQFKKLDKYLVNVKRGVSGSWSYEINFPL